MKKRSTLVLLGIASLAILFVACRKEINTPDGNEVGNTPLPTTGTYCRIESIWLNPGASSQSYWLIAYDEFENPKFITTPLPATGQPFREFKYDGWHRLREYVGDYGNGTSMDLIGMAGLVLTQIMCLANLEKSQPIISTELFL
jgi:hypothetical protein